MCSVIDKKEINIFYSILNRWLRVFYEKWKKKKREIQIMFGFPSS